MKIIISRKGFDTSNGGIPSPILPDGTLLSMPIPSDNDRLTYDDLLYGGVTYKDILKQLASKRRFINCHLDPDIREDVRKQRISDWMPAFGQIGASQTYLSNRGLKAGDLFLFFGRFQETTGSFVNGTLRYKPKAPILHIIYGYMEIGDIVLNEKIRTLNYNWHPHGYGERLNIKTNALYLPSEYLSFLNNRRGWGTFDYNKNRVLTLSDKTATWREIPCLMPEFIDRNVKNDAVNGGIFYNGIWQEMVLKESDFANAWLGEVFCN